MYLYSKKLKIVVILYLGNAKETLKMPSVKERKNCIVRV